MHSARHACAEHRVDARVAPVVHLVTPQHGLARPAQRDAALRVALDVVTLVLARAALVDEQATLRTSRRLRGTARRRRGRSREIARDRGRSHLPRPVQPIAAQ